MTRRLDRRSFLGVMAAATATTACAPTDPCGTHDPWRWLSSADAEAAARDIPGEHGLWDTVEGTPAHIRRFREAIDRFALRPRVLVDVRKVDLSITLLGEDLPAPFLMAPGLLRIPHLGVVSDVIAGALADDIRFVRDASHPRGAIPPSQEFVAVPWHRFGPGTARGERTLATEVRSVSQALEAVRRGAQGLVLSNGLGPSNGEPSSLELLPLIREAVPSAIPLVVEGSFRHANGMLIALGLGATAVTVGWPAAWGAVAAGPAGAFRTLELLRMGLARALRLCGQTQVRTIGPDLVRREPVL